MNFLFSRVIEVFANVPLRFSSEKYFTVKSLYGLSGDVVALLIIVKYQI